MNSCSVTRIAVVGYGYWGSKHVRVLITMPDVDVVIVERDHRRRSEARRHFPSALAVADLGEVIDEIDGVIVATPPTLHASVAARVLVGGLPVLVEKPLATTVTDAEQLVALADAHHARLMVGHTFEYHAAVWKLREIIRSGELGRILYLDTARLNLGLYQSDVNVIWDLAPHDVSIASYLLGELPTSVATWSHHNVDHRHADVAYLRLQFGSGVSAFIHVSWLDPQKTRRVTVVGDLKMAVYNDMLDTDRIRVHDIGVDPVDLCEPAESHARPMSYRAGDIVSPHINLHEPLLVQDTHFVDCVRTGGQPTTPGTRGLDIVRVLSASDRGEGLPIPVYEPRTGMTPPVPMRLSTINGEVPVQ